MTFMFPTDSAFSFKPRYRYVGFKVLTPVVMKSFVFWDITPYNSLNFNRRFRGTRCLHLQGKILSLARACYELHSDLLACSWTVEMDPICFSETSVDFQRTTRRYIPEDRIMYVISVHHRQSQPYNPVALNVSISADPNVRYYRLAGMLVLMLWHTCPIPKCMKPVIFALLQMTSFSQNLWRKTYS
jgi:hypothetical protein